MYRGFRGGRGSSRGRGGYQTDERPQRANTMRDSTPVQAEDSAKPLNVNANPNVGREDEVKKEGKKKNTFKPKGVPSAKHVSTSFSAFNEEPMFGTEINDIIYSGKVQAGGEAQFTTTSVGITDLVELVYNQMIACSRQFSKNLSLSMFNYYVTELFWMRICEIELREGNLDPEVRNMCENSVHRNWAMPELISNFLNSIGAFKDSTGIIARHREITWPGADRHGGICGFFDRVSVDIHMHYENRPAPGVAAFRIGRDLDFTVNPNVNVEWNLPVNLQPEEEHAGLPTANMLGWHIPSNLTEEQHIGLE